MQHGSLPPVEGSQRGLDKAYKPNRLGPLQLHSRRAYLVTFLTLNLSSYRRSFQHLILEIYAASVAFIAPVGQPCVAAPLTPAELFYLVLDHPANVAYSAIYVITTIIADSFLVRNSIPFTHFMRLLSAPPQTYRLYVVWNDNRYIIIPPIFFCIGLLGKSSKA